MTSVSRVRVRNGRARALAVAVLILAGCAPPTRVVSQWHDPSYDKSGLTNLLVLGLQPDPGKRRIWEDSFCEALSRYGVRATPSYPDFPNVPRDSNEVRDYVRQKGFDGVVITRKLSTDEVHTYVPPTTTVVSSGAYWGPYPYWGGYYGAYAPAVSAYTTPGYVETDRIVTVETTVWGKVGDRGQMIWSGITETTNPTSPKDFSAELGASLLPQMERDGIIKKIKK
jgi:hypothetical protein